MFKSSKGLLGPRQFGPLVGFNRAFKTFQKSPQTVSTGPQGWDTKIHTNGIAKEKLPNMPHGFRQVSARQRGGGEQIR